MFPAWYDPAKGGFPDAEALVADLFKPLLDGVEFVPSLPPPDEYEAILQQGRAIARYARTGGRINFDQNRDEPRVQVAVIARSRAKSWELIEFHRQVLWTFERGGLVPGTPHLLQTAEETLGPQMIPETIVEPRLVPITFGLHTRKPGGTNYRQYLT
ncbi:hypothetical protein A5722_05145 [Mycobacterium vulneris]|nr:hypothetical protein A5721_26170 [Mycolicibacterium vulneris]OCB59141.1 hypothetical protein A5722_05145 [Mycolicibacterium vulneris]OCB61503.1 hypothetical protein A5729_03820 [Mycolicibacterium vulneris]